MIVLPEKGSAQFDIQGHRGCRGMLPENSIAGFIKAVAVGVTTLEMDVVISGDNRVVVSHEPYMSAEICTHPDKRPIAATEEKELNIYRMDTATIRQYDCGSIGNHRFAEQIAMSVSKPMLDEVIDEVEKYVKDQKLAEINYSIEIKSTAAGDNIFHPSPQIFTDFLMQVIAGRNIQKRVIVQCFDLRVLKYLHTSYPDIKTALLVDNIKGISYNLEQLGFTPTIYSPHYKILRGPSVSRLQKMGMKVIPWTVNDEKDMLSLIAAGVDGIITDYPEKLIKVLNGNFNPLQQ
jgi:glycerophosphoryl diester phosphodiesterase